LTELGLAINPNIAYDLDSMFPKLTGWGSKGQIKQKHKMLLLIEPFLSEILLEGEDVLFVSKGVQFSFVEQYFLGIWAMLINQTVFVQTNTRLLLIHSNTSGKPKHTNWMIYYSQIESFKVSWSGSVSLKLKDGKKFTFTGFQGPDKKQMPAIFESAMETYREFNFNPAVTQSRENLCSKCNQVVPKGMYQCDACGQQYWKPSEIALRSLAFPSWGDFVMGHTVLACVELMGYLFSWLILFSIFVGLIDEPGGLIGAVAISIFVLGIAHGIDAGLTYFIAKKGLNPRGGVKK
jgi:hypothetical protein